VAKKGEIGSLARDRQHDGARRWALKHWHALDVSVYPQEQQIFEEDRPRLIRDWILPGHVPSQGMLSASDGVITLGSCFASELRNYLHSAGVGSGLLWVPSDLNNTFAIRDFVSWCVTGQETPRGFSYTRAADGEIREWTPDAERVHYLEALERAGAFVFTFGLAEAWEDRETGGIFWRGIPAELFDEERYVFRLTTVEENEVNIGHIIELVRSVNATAPIILTLSPVPLKATFRGISCITADCVSKATLRVALDRVMSSTMEGVYYWPAFEVVRWAGANLSIPAFGADDSRSRHVSQQLVAEIISAFLETYYTPTAVAELKARVIERELEKASRNAGSRKNGMHPERSTAVAGHGVGVRAMRVVRAARKKLRTAVHDAAVRAN
jgi:hypothetical protein